MNDETEKPDPQKRLAEEYGDVALGVECAWPVSVPDAELELEQQ
jgi:hypothetical protein